MSRYHIAHLLIEAAGKKRVKDLAAKHGFTEDEIRAMAEFDPSKTDKFLGWIAVQAETGDLSIPADGPELKTLLEDFERKGKLTGEPDINKWTFTGLKEKLGVTESKGEVNRSKVEEGQRVVHDAPPFPGVAWNWKVIEITTPEAADKLCRPEWCIKDEKFWDEYGCGPNAPAYLVFRDGEKHACMVPHRGEIKNTDDEPLEPTESFYELLKELMPRIHFIVDGDFVDFLPLMPEDEVASDPEKAFMYAEHIVEERWPKGEAAIARDPKWSFFYATHVLGKRFPAGEPVIASDPDFALKYVTNVVKKRWPKGEAAIASNSRTAYWYATTYVGGRWPEGEDAIYSTSWGETYDKFLNPPEPPGPPMGYVILFDGDYAGFHSEDDEDAAMARGEAHANGRKVTVERSPVQTR